MKKLRFGFRKLKNVGRSTETDSTSSSVCDKPDTVRLLPISLRATHENSTPQLVLVTSSAKSRPNPNTLRFW